MPVEYIRLTQTARYQLGTLTGRTKIEHRNVLLRWAYCRSLAEPNRIPPSRIRLDPDMVPIAWNTFAGDYGDILWALLRMRVHEEGLPLDEETLATQFFLHLHRGIGYLVGDPEIRDITGLVARGTGGADAETETGR